MRQTFAACCARATSGQAAADPTIPLIKSRRCIASPKAYLLAPTVAQKDWITAGILIARNWLSDCFAKQQFVGSNVRFGSKADIGARPVNVCFTPKSGHWNSVSICKAWLLDHRTIGVLRRISLPNQCRSVYPRKEKPTSARPNRQVATAAALKTS